MDKEEKEDKDTKEEELTVEEQEIIKKRIEELKKQDPFIYD
jgi:hypothetical protein